MSKDKINIYLIIIIIVFSVVAGAALASSIYNRKMSKIIQKENIEKIKAINDRTIKTLMSADSIMMEFESQRQAEQARLNELDSIVVMYEKDIKSLKWSYFKLKNERNELQSQIDSIGSVIDLREL